MLTFDAVAESELPKLPSPVVALGRIIASPGHGETHGILAPPRCLTLAGLELQHSSIPRKDTFAQKLRLHLVQCAMSNAVRYFELVATFQNNPVLFLFVIESSSVETRPADLA